MKPVAVTTALLILSGAAAGIQPAGVENVTLQLNFNASEVYRSGTQTTPGEYNPSSYPYLSSNKPEALVPYGDTEELTNIYMPDGLVAYYPLDETTGNTANDITTTLPDNDGTHVNFDGDELGAKGNISTAYDFDGDDEYVETDNFPVRGRSPRTVSAWYKTSKDSTWFQNNERWASLVDFPERKSPEGSFMLAVSSSECNANAIAIHMWGTNTCSGKTVEDVGLNEWHHLVGVMTGNGEQRIYIDGELEGTSSFNPDTPTGPIQIGRRSYYNKFYFNGEIDDVRIYNRSLSQREVERLYNYSRGQPGTEQISATISSGGFLVANTKGGTPSIESRREAVNSRSLLGRIDPSFGFNPSRSPPTTNIVYRSPYNLTGDSFSSASSGIVLRNTAGLGDNATVSVAPIG